jgi:hypothetical protein
MVNMRQRMICHQNNYSTTRRASVPADAVRCSVTLGKGKMSHKQIGIIFGLIIHIIIFAFMVYPMNTHSGDAALGFVLPSMILYFPVSLFAFMVASGGSTNLWFTNTILIVGAFWYALIGSWIGGAIGRKRNR